MITCYDVIKALVRTEKGSLVEHQGKYLFHVDMTANKIDVKRSIEEIYKVKVSTVNTVICRGKLKRVRTKQGLTSDWKKAVVTLKAGQKIEVK